MLAHPAKLWLINTDLDAGNGYRDQNEPAKPDCSPRGVAAPRHQSHKPAPRSRRCIEHRLHVRGRAADDAEHLGRCRLMLQGLAQFCVALLHSLNSRTFSMAMTAWSAKVSSSAICFSVNGRTSVRRIIIAPMATPSRSNGVARMVRMPTLLRDCAVRKLVSISASKIVDVDRLPVDNGSAAGRAAMIGDPHLRLGDGP